ncbi:MAG: ABC transporter ATP-binding protein [Phycisphaerales bacterium]|nr:ABC transporter ATP-binding protein [Phycisphaerales bacterium]
MMIGSATIPAPIDNRLPPDAEPSSGAIVRLVDIWKSFGRQEVLRGIDMNFQRGRTTVVLGPSGCGKSVMLKHIVGLIRPDRGEVWFEGSRVDRMKDRELGEVRRQIGFLFQQSALFDSMSVHDNVAFPLVELTRMGATEREARVESVLGTVGLHDTGAKMPADLSGGQRKRVALARAIVLEPKVVLYDEPTTGLDPIRADLIAELILRLQQRAGITSIIVTHDLQIAFKVADRMMILYDGKVIADGTPDAIRSSTDPVIDGFLNARASPEELAAINDAPGLADDSRGNRLDEG